MTLKNKEIPSVIKPDKSPPTKSVINYELVWQIIFVFISIISAILINKVYQYQTLPEFQNVRKGNIFELLIFGIPCGIVFITLESMFHKYLDDKIELNYINHEKYRDQESRKKRCYKLGKWAFSLFYYGFTSIFGYMVIRDTSFMPTWLGGQGHCTYLTRYIYSLEEANNYMKAFYIMQFGKHLCRLIHHCFFKLEGNFYEYALHHGLSTFLILFSYLMNMWLIGIFVLLIHDISDIVLIVGRGYRDCRKVNRPLLMMIDVVGFMIWIFCRIVLLSYCCVYSSVSTAWDFWWDQKANKTKIYEVLIFPGVFMGFMLFSLLVLQVFWTYQILASIITVNVKKNLMKLNQ